MSDLIEFRDRRVMVMTGRHNATARGEVQAPFTARCVAVNPRISTLILSGEFGQIEARAAICEIVDDDAPEVAAEHVKPTPPAPSVDEVNRETLAKLAAKLDTLEAENAKLRAEREA